jgi:protein involved in ribonucleotide reduction
VVKLINELGEGLPMALPFVYPLKQRGVELSISIVYFSNYSGNTKRFVERLTDGGIRIPIRPSDARDLVVSGDYVLVVPTYGGGAESPAIPKSVKVFLNNENNRNFLRGVIGTGNTNFGEHYCKAADMISEKTGVPIIGRVEIFGTEEDVHTIRERLELLYG